MHLPGNTERADIHGGLRGGLSAPFMCPGCSSRLSGNFQDASLRRSRKDFSDAHSSSYPEGSSYTLILLEVDSFAP